jgi:regulatory protein
MIITAIKQQLRAKGRYSIYVDTRYAFSLSADALLAERLVPGQELDTQELKQYKTLSGEDRASDLAVTYAVSRRRSRWELHEYFRRKEWGDELQQKIIKRLEQLDLVNDEEFAEAWVRNRRLLKPVSRRRLVQELHQKHVAAECIERALQGDETSERDVLLDLISRRRRQTRYQDDIKLMQYLVRQGFGYDEVKAALAGAD